MMNGILHQTLASPTGKLAGINSVNGSSFNKICNKLALQEGTTCSNCYAKRYQRIYKALGLHLEHNTSILTTETIKRRDLPVFHDNETIRFNSYGNIYNSQQMLNYRNICLKNKNTQFALWFKNVPAVASVLEQYGKPSNLILIYSVMSVDPTSIRIPKRIKPYVDKTFAVYKKPGPNININCKGACKSCMICYTKNNVNRISEVLK